MEQHVTKEPFQPRRGRLLHGHSHPANRKQRRRQSERSPGTSLAARLRYRFDRSLSHGPLGLVAWLGAAVLAVVALASALADLFRLTFGGGRNDGIPESLWQSMLRSVDTGTLANDNQWPTRIIGLVLTLAGIFLAGALIGIIANALDQRVDRLRRGRSQVVESGHTLVLGWSSQLFAIVRELVIANENVRDASIVILSPQDKVEMESELVEKVGSFGSTRVVCRTGNPAKPADLALVRAQHARSVIVLPGDEGDAFVVKAVLAVRTLDPSFRNAHVVVELEEPEHAHTLRVLTDGAVVSVNSDRVIAEVTAQACHQAGLSFLFRELLDFDGDELYFAEVPELVGHSYEEALLAFEDSSLVGIFTAGGLVELNPPHGTVFEPGDQVIAVSEDDDTVVFTGFRTPGEVVPAGRPDAAKDPLRVLLVGWSEFAPKVLHELDEFVAAGSTVTVVVHPDLADLSALDELRLVNADLTVSRRSGGPEELLDLRADRFDQVIVLGYRGAVDASDADARTLLTLLTLRKMWPEVGHGCVRIIAELRDQTNLPLAQTTGADDFIVSDALTSLMLAQLSERPELQAVFDDLFDPEGAVVELRPAPWYAPAGVVPFADVVAAASGRGASAFGYRVGASGVVVVNPPKSEPVRLTADDQVLIVGLRGA